MKEWWTATELAGMCGMPNTPRAITLMGQTGRLTRRQRPIGKGWEYHLSSLPAETQDHLRAQSGEPGSYSIDSPVPAAVIQGPWVGSTTTPAAAPVLAAISAVNPATFPAPQPLPDLDALQAWSADRALRLSLKDLQDPRVQAKVRCAQALETCAWGTREVTVAQLAEQYDISAPTVRRWADEVASWRVKSRLPSVQMLDTSITLPAVKSFDQAAVQRGIEIYAGNIKNGRKAAYTALCTEAQAAGWRVGDYSSFTRILAKIPERFWQYIQQGETGFELGVTPKIVRAWLSVPAYSVVCGDQNIPDYLVFEPATGEVYTPELYLWMDCTSRAWVGLWPAWGHYSRYTVGYALREACRIATPAEIFTDWGKPETSHYSQQVVAGLRGYCAAGDWSDYASRYAERDLVGAEGDITHRKTTRVGIPWQKPIEPQMAVLKREYLNRFTPGFRQRLPGAWENDERSAQIKRERLSGKLLTTEEFLELTRDIAADHNAKSTKLKESPVPIVPSQVLERSLRDNPRPVFDDITLDLIFLPRFVRVPHQSTVRVQVAPGDLRHYYAAELSRTPRGERVQVSVDPFDTDKDAVITTLRGDYLCTAEPWKVQQPDDRAGLSHKIQRQMELMRWWKKEIKQLRGDTHAVPRIAAQTKTAKQAAAAETAKPEKGAAKRADAKLIELFGGGRTSGQTPA